MVGVHLGALLGGQHLDHDQPAINGREGQGFEAQHGPLAALDLVGGGDELQVLDADAVGAGLVVARFVGDDHARLQGDIVGRLGDPLRAFVHAEIAAHPVAGAMVIVEASHPQGRAGQDVQGRAGGSGRETDMGQRQVALQHQGEAFGHLPAGLADGDGAGDVGGAVQILAAGIHQQKGAGFRALVQALGGPVVDDGAV